MISNNDLSVPDTGSLRQLQSGDYANRKHNSPFPKPEPTYFDEDRETEAPFLSDKPVIINHPGDRNYEKVEEIEENLSLEQMEKDMISKALKKHKGRRKDAAVELGISERTLYRKIKFYAIDE